MSRPKKNYIPICIKMDAEIERRLEEYCEKMGQTKTIAIERMVKEYLDNIKEMR